MRDKEWLKGLINEEGIVTDMRLLDRHDEQYWKNENIKINKGRLFYLIDQLDEPKKVVVPKFVADWIEQYIDYGYDLYPALKKMENNSRSWIRIYEWYRENTFEFVLAYLTQEYEMEEEQKYYVSARDEEYGGFWFLSKNNNGDISIGVGRDCSEVDWDRLKLTEQEIKDYDERYWAFAEEVQE